MDDEYLGLEDGGGILREDLRCGGVVLVGLVGVLRFGIGEYEGVW